MSLSRSVGVSKTRTSPTAIALMPCLDLRVSEPNVINIPIVNVPAEVFEQELAQGHWSQSFTSLTSRSMSQLMMQRIISNAPLAFRAVLVSQHRAGQFLPSWLWLRMWSW